MNSISNLIKLDSECWKLCDSELKCPCCVAFSRKLGALNGNLPFCVSFVETSFVLTVTLSLADLTKPWLSVTGSGDASWFTFDASGR